MIQAVLIYIGLSLDTAVVMMHKGATLKDIDFKKGALFSLVYALIAVAVFACGYGAASLLMKSINDKFRVGLVSLILVIAGDYVLIKSFIRAKVVEHVDSDFDMKNMTRLALLTNITAFFISACFALMGISLLHALLLCFLVSFVCVFVSMRIGYSVGAGYERTVGIIGGTLMIAFGIYFFLTYGLG